MTSNLISVVMSVYNGERFLREAVDSILNQTYTGFEFIIINDGSTDRSIEILQSYQDPRIILVNQENAGVTKALNKGLALAKGKYIARQDADDISKLERLERQVAFMEANPKVGLLGTRFQCIDHNGHVTRQAELQSENKWIQNRLTTINHFCHGSVMIRRDALDKVGLFREYFKYAQDYDLWLRIAEQYEVSNLPEYLFCYRELEEAISSDKILVQSLYAGVAAELALQRRKTGTDALLDGQVPEQPHVNRLSNVLQEKLLDFYCRNPHKMLDGFRGDLNTDSDLTYLFEKICAEKLKCQNELYNKNTIIEKVGERTAGLLHEFRSHMDQMVRETLETIQNRLAEELHKKDEIIKSKDQKLEENTAHIRRLEEGLRNRDEEITRLNHQFADMERQLLQIDRSFQEQRAQVLVKTDELRFLREELDRIQKEKVVESLNYERQITEKAHCIEALLNSKSWKITAPLRKALSILNGK